MKGRSFFVGATHASPCKPQHACRNGATHAAPLRSFVTGPICGRGSNPPLSLLNRRYQKSLLLRRRDACVSLQTTARMSKRGDACVAPTKLCHRPYLRAGFNPPAIVFNPAAIKGPSYFAGRRMRRPANHSTHVETGRRMRRPYEALSPALSAGGFQTPRYQFQTRRYQRSLLLRRSEAFPRPLAACSAVDGVTHASPLLNFVICPM